MSASPSSSAPNSTTSTASSTTKKDFYTLLGLRPGASVQDVRRAYRDLSKLYHPDTTELESAIATLKFQALNEAYATLSNPEKRLAYDYKIGYSRLSVMQPLSNVAPNNKKYNPSDSAYISPSDRPLSPGELFALSILGITFIGCLILVFTIGLAKSELPITQVNASSNDISTEPTPTEPELTEPELTEPTSQPTEDRRAQTLNPTHSLKAPTLPPTRYKNLPII